MPEQYAVLAKDALAPGAVVNFRSTPLPFAGRIRRVIVRVGEANGSGASTFDVNLDGVSIFASPEERPSIPAGETVTTVSNLSIPHTAVAQLSVDADAVPAGGLTGVSVVVVTDDLLGDRPVPIEFFVRAAYQGALSREPDADELSAALSSLRAACYGFTFTAAARTLLESLFTSTEFTSLTLTDTQYVTRLYLAYLNRDPGDDPDGLSGWVASLVGGQTRAQVRNAFATSIEFTNRGPLFCRSSAPSADATSIEGKAPAEFVRDAMAAAFIDSTELDFTADDPGDTATASLKTTGVSAGSYGDSTHIPQFTVDSKGRLTVASQVAAAGGSSARLIVDGLAPQYDPAPASPNTQDDEFDGSSLASKWTATTNTVASVSFNSLWKSHLAVKFSAASQTYIIQQSYAPSGDFSITLGAHVRVVGAGSPFIRLRARNSTGQEAISALLLCSNSVPRAQIESVDTGTTTIRSSVNFTGDEWRGRAYLHLQRAGTSWTFWLSRDGLLWQPIGTYSKTVSVDNIQITMTQSNTPDAGLTWGLDFFRRDWITVS